MLSDILQIAKNEMVNGVKIKGHPFRFFTFATINQQKPSIRTVVLRKIKEDFTLIFYTDARSPKIKDLSENQNCSALFYHPEKMIQLKIEGQAYYTTDQEELQELYNDIPTASRKDYITSTAPGTKLNNPDNLQYLDERNYFALVTIKPKRVEYLALKRPNHIRAEFLPNNHDWVGRFLVP